MLFYPDKPMERPVTVPDICLFPINGIYVQYQYPVFFARLKSEG